MLLINSEMRKTISYMFEYLTNLRLEDAELCLSINRKWLVVVRKGDSSIKTTECYILDISSSNWKIVTDIVFISDHNVESIAINDDEDQIALAVVDKGIKFINYNNQDNSWKLNEELHTHKDIKPGNRFGGSMVYDGNQNLLISSPFDSVDSFNSIVHSLYIFKNESLKKVSFNDIGKGNIIVEIYRLESYPNFIGVQSLNRKSIYLKTNNYDELKLYSWSEVQKEYPKHK